MNSRNNISDLFFQAATKHPEKLAIVDPSGSISYGELENQVNQTSQYFLERGIGKGDRVLIFVPMSLDLYRIVLSLFHIGATAVFLDEWVSFKRMEACCNLIGCKAFIGTPKARVLALLSGSLRRIPIKLGRSFKSPLRSNHLIPSTEKDDTALITFTTGTTGIPKAANRTHGFLQAQFEALIDKIKPGGEDVDMPALPIVLLINLGFGCTSVIADFKATKPDSLDPEKVARQIEKHQVNRIESSPFFVKKLAQYLIQSNGSLPSVKSIFTGGAPVFPSEATLYTKAFPQSKIEIVYGSTEAEPISAVTAEELVSDTGHPGGLLVGKVYSGASVRIIRINNEPIQLSSDQELQNLEVESGSIGEIIVSGAHVLSSYINNEPAIQRNKIFIDFACWHRTGDSGFRDSDGNLYLTGRCSSLIHHQDKIITPFTYEKTLSEIAGISLGTVLNLNGSITLVVELVAGTDRSQLEAKLSQSGLYYDDIRYITKMPRDKRHNSRVDYETLTKELIS